MPLEISTARNRHDLHNLSSFMQVLRRYKKSSLIEVGTRRLWEGYRDQNFRQRQRQDWQLINSYTPRIVLLGMAAANEFRDRIANPTDILGFCHDYLGIYDGQYFTGPALDAEADVIRIALLEGDVIPKQYLIPEHLRHSCLEFSLMRLLRSQHETFHTGMEEFVRAYRIFELWDQAEGGRPDEVCRSIFNITPIHFFRSGFMLFALANHPEKLGHLSLKNLTAEIPITNDYQIDPDTCRLVASRISMNESDLRDWYQKILNDVPEQYQKFFPVPLYKYPLIHRDLREREIDYLIPSPALFIRGFVNSFFSQIFENSEENRFANALPSFGNAVEEYMAIALGQIFGQENVTRITATEEHADFLIRHDECDLVVEIKTTLGGYQDQAMMTPEAIQRLWRRLYKATCQCAASIRHYRRGDHPIVGLMFIAEHMTGEAMPFLSLADRSGMFRDMDIAGVDILPWNSVELSLSKTSVDKFMTTIKRKWFEGQRQSAGDLLTFEMDRDNPAHNFEHLEDTYRQLFPGRVARRLPLLRQGGN